MLLICYCLLVMQEVTHLLNFCNMSNVILLVASWLLEQFLTQSLFTAVGSVVGMTIAIRGGDAVVWYRHAPEAFPYIKVG